MSGILSIYSPVEAYLRVCLLSIDVFARIWPYTRLPPTIWFGVIITELFLYVNTKIYIASHKRIWYNLFGEVFDMQRKNKNLVVRIDEERLNAIKEIGIPSSTMVRALIDFFISQSDEVQMRIIKNPKEMRFWNFYTFRGQFPLR